MKIRLLSTSGKAIKSSISVREEVTFPQSFLKRHSSQDCGPFTSQRKQPIALCTLINHFHPVSLPPPCSLQPLVMWVWNPVCFYTKEERQRNSKQEAIWRFKRDRDPLALKGLFTSSKHFCPRAIMSQLSAIRPSHLYCELTHRLIYSGLSTQESITMPGPLSLPQVLKLCGL